MSFSRSPFHRWLALRAAPARRSGAMPGSPGRRTAGRELRVAVAVLLLATLARVALGDAGLASAGETSLAAHGGSELTLPHPPPGGPHVVADGLLTSEGIPCYGPVERGEKYFRVFYAHLTGQPDAFAQRETGIRGDLGLTDAAIAESARRTGGVRHLRLDTGSDCVLRVARTAIPEASWNPTQIRQHLVATGELVGDEKAIVYADWSPTQPICGWSELYDDEQPGEFNANNRSSTASVTYTSCLNRGTTGHEVMHALGAVQDGAPHSTSAFHCSDEYDRMCYRDAPDTTLTFPCAQEYDQLFDCGGDDFYNVTPPAGSYLATHWNVANSSYLWQSPPPRWDTTGTPAPTPTPTPTPTPGPTPQPSPTAAGTTPGFDGSSRTTERIDAADFSSAAIAISRLRFNASGAAGRHAAHAVLSRDDQFPDSLSGASLTGDGPMLFTNRAALDPATAAELRRALAPGATVYLLGGEAALAPEVARSVAAAGFTPVRLQGGSRVETSLAVASEVRRLHPDQRQVALARAYGPADSPTAAWADAVTGGAVGAELGMPIVVVPSESLPGEVAGWLRDAAPSRTVLFGGTVALSPAIEAAVPNPLRVSGPERTATAVAVAGTLWQRGDARRHVVVHGGRPDGWAFGMAAAGLAADSDAPLLLVGDDVPEPTATLLSRCGSPASDLLLIGGPTIISEQVRLELDRLDGQAC